MTNNVRAIAAYKSKLYRNELKRILETYGSAVELPFSREKLLADKEKLEKSKRAVINFLYTDTIKWIDYMLEQEKNGRVVLVGENQRKAV